MPRKARRPIETYTPQKLKDLIKGAEGVQIFYAPAGNKGESFLRIHCWGRNYFPEIPGRILVEIVQHRGKLTVRESISPEHQREAGAPLERAWCRQRLDVRRGISYREYEEAGTTEERVLEIVQVLGPMWLTLIYHPDFPGEIAPSAALLLLQGMAGWETHTAPAATAATPTGKRTGFVGFLQAMLPWGRRSEETEGEIKDAQHG